MSAFITDIPATRRPRNDAEELAGYAPTVVHVGDAGFLATNERSEHEIPSEGLKSNAPRY